MHFRRLGWVALGVALAGFGGFRHYEVRKEAAEEAFGIAVAAIDVPVILALAEQGVDINTRDFSGRTALTAAVHLSEEALLDTLLQRGADVNAADRTGLTPLIVAARLRGADAVEKLLVHGADVEARGWFGVTPLLAAVRAGKHENVRVLLSYGANPRVPDDRRTTPLHEAAARADVEMTRALLVAGARADARDRYGNTPLALARGAGRQQRRPAAVIEVLIRAGTAPNPGGRQGGVALAFASARRDAGRAQVRALRSSAGRGSSRAWRIHLPAPRPHQTPGRPRAGPASRDLPVPLLMLFGINLG